MARGANGSVTTSCAVLSLHVLKQLFEPGADATTSAHSTLTRDASVPLMEALFDRSYRISALLVAPSKRPGSSSTETRTLQVRQH